MMTIEEALLEVHRIVTLGWQAREYKRQQDPDAEQSAMKEAIQKGKLFEYLEESNTFSSGKVLVIQQLNRSMVQCHVCGAYSNSGSYVVKHEDGRYVKFAISLCHDAQAGHSISGRDTVAKTLAAIMEDA